MTWDIVIHRGLLIDGSGSQGTIADIALAAGRIAAIGPSLPGEASKVIDAEGLAVTPGFIDIKTHSDFVLPINPKAESKVRQGVTTEIIGHCGFSVAPVLPGKTQLLADYLSGGAPWLPFREMGFPEYLDTFPAVAVNAIAPGIMDTAQPRYQFSEAEMVEQSRLVPLGNMASPADIADVLVFLASRDASFMTGATDHTDGGLCMA